MVDKNSLPIRTVEMSGLRKLLETFDPRHKIPSQRYFSRTALPALYSKVRYNVHRTKRSQSFFSYKLSVVSEGLLPFVNYTVHLVKEGKL